VTSRIVAAVLALITAALASMAIPLGLLTAAQDRRDFRDDTLAAAGTAANLAEEGIGDGSGGPLLGRAVRDLARRGDRVGVYDAAGHEVAGAGPAPLPSESLHAALRDPSPRSYPAADGRLTVTVPVRADGGRLVIGTVALSRPTTTLTHRITDLWTLIGAVSLASLLAAVLIAVGLARWASRPITTLAEAARRLGDGDLETRAGIRSGPPEVRRLAAAFSTMAARLQALIRGHQTMVADVSHQVRTPLAALRLRLDLLAQDCDEATAAELAGAQEEIGRLTRLVNGLLTVARAEHSTTAPVRVAADAVAADRAAAWRPAAEERGVTLTTVSPDPVGVQAVDGHLEQVLDNLLANALEEVPPGGTITLTVSAAAARARVTVADTGRGMTAAQQQAAFRRFATGSPGGTGLGLAIVDRLVTANGGTASLSDTPGGGLTVTIELPLSPDRAGRAAPRILTGPEEVLNESHAAGPAG
jgi:signal transduction histidine kinase